MEKRMTRLLRVLEAEFALFWILVVAGCVSYEMDVLPQGSMVGDAQAEYILQTVGILLTVCLIPLSLRMFSLSLTRYVRQLSLPEALVSYRRWCEIVWPCCWPRHCLILPCIILRSMLPVCCVWACCW